MWRSVGLVAGLFAICALLIACGGGGGDDDAGVVATMARSSATVSADESSTACNYLTPGPTANSIRPVSIEEAEDILGFNVLLPRDLPDGVTAGEPHVYRNPFCPYNLIINGVEINYRGPGYSILLMERPAGSAHEDFEESIKINGVDGTIRRDGPVIVVTWSDGERRYSASAELRGGLSEELLLEILDSIPE